MQLGRGWTKTSPFITPLLGGLEDSEEKELRTKRASMERE